MLLETRKRGSCSQAFCIWPSISFQLLVFPRSSWQVAINFRQIWVSGTQSAELVSPANFSSGVCCWLLYTAFCECLFFFFFLEKALVFATWVTYGHMDSHTWTALSSIIPSAFLACLELKKFSSLDKLHVSEKAAPLSHCPMYSNNRVDILSLLQQISIISENIWLKNHYSLRSGGSVWSEKGQVFTLLPVKFCLKKEIMTARPIVGLRREDLEMW